jgi:hypothetical protein
VLQWSKGQHEEVLLTRSIRWLTNQSNKKQMKNIAVTKNNYLTRFLNISRKKARQL